MPERQSDTGPEIQYHVLQNHAETHQICHDAVLFHWTETPRKEIKPSCHTRTRIMNFPYVVTKIKQVHDYFRAFYEIL